MLTCGVISVCFENLKVSTDRQMNIQTAQDSQHRDDTIVYDDAECVSANRIESAPSST